MKQRMKPKVGDHVYRLGDGDNVYTIVNLRTAEPSYLVQLGHDETTREWMITEDLEFELAPRLVKKEDKHA